MSFVLNKLKRLPVFWVSAITVAFCILAVGLTLGGMSYRNAITRGLDDLHLRGVEVANLVAHQSGGALKFGKEDKLVALLGDVQALSENDITFATAVPASGSFTASVGDAAPQATALARLAAETGQPQLSEDRLTMAVPARFGPQADVVGAVAMIWSPDRTMALIMEHELEAIMTSLLMTLLAIAGSTAFLRYYVSRPLLGICGGIDALSAADYDNVSLRQDRGDEIGQVNRAILGFRDTLRNLDTLRNDALFKGSAVESSSMALILLDPGFTVKTLNSSARMLLSGGADASDGEQENCNYIGSDIRSIGIFRNQLSKDHFAAELLPHMFDLTLEAGDFSIAINTVSGDDNQPAGYVLELANVTQARLNTAIMDSLDKDQAIAEFDLDGLLVAANERFRKLFNAVGMGALQGKNAEVLFELAPATEDEASVLDRLSRGESVFDKFCTRPGNGTVSVVDGGFSTVLDRNGKPTRLILIGKDVTEAEAEIAASREQQEAMQEMQSSVVEAFRVALRRIRSGDLTAQIDAIFSNEYNELKADFNEALGSISEAMQIVVENAGAMHSETAEISKSAESLATRTESNAATLAETAAALDQLTGLVNTAAKGADQANGVVRNARERAMQSGEIVNEAVSAMSQIEDSSGKIASIIDVIEDIAFQTNLLALNAGVEAARAGEAGRGFAVVASEVRALAQRSSDAAREINTLITGSGVQVKRGVDLVGKTGNALEDIVSSIGEIAELVAGIAASSNEQSTGVSEINTAVNQLDQATQQYAAMFEETSAASQALVDVARTLDQAVDRFKTDAQRSASSHSSPAGAGHPPAAMPSNGPTPVAPVLGNTALALADAAPEEDGWEEF